MSSFNFANVSKRISTWLAAAAAFAAGLLALTDKLPAFLVNKLPEGLLELLALLAALAVPVATSYNQKSLKKD